MTAVKVKTSTGWVTLSGGGVPLPVVNGQWLKAVGGAAVWAPIGDADVSAAAPRLGPSAAPAIADCNTTVASGWYAVYPNTPNAPTTGYWTLHVISFGPNDVRQYAYDDGGTRTFVRAHTTAWTAWEQTWPLPAQAVQKIASYDNTYSGSGFVIPIPGGLRSVSIYGRFTMPPADGNVDLYCRTNGLSTGYNQQYLAASGSTVGTAQQIDATGAYVGTGNGNWIATNWELLFPFVDQQWGGYGGYWRAGTFWTTGAGGYAYRWGSFICRGGVSGPLNSVQLFRMDAGTFTASINVYGYAL